MKSDKLFYALISAGVALAGLTQSCVSDEPFGYGSGEGRLRMQVVLNSDVTRAETDVNALSDGCTIYLSGGDGQGLLYKYQGIGQIPEGGVTLKSGNYVLEAWAGDSVPASFNSKFYRGYERFIIESGAEKAVKLTCRIANVAVSVDPESVVKDVMAPDWNVKVFSTTGTLDFTAENAKDSIGYFMMSSRDIAYDGAGNVRTGDDGWTQYTNLYYTVTGSTLDGRKFEKTGLIGKVVGGDTIVEHAHQYVLRFQYSPEYEEQGGGVITIKVDDREIVENHEIGLYSAPAIKGQNFDIARQITGEAHGFDQYVVKVAGFNEIKRLSLSTDDYRDFGLPNRSFNLMDLADKDVEALIRATGFDWEYTKSDDPTKVSKCFLYFKDTFLNHLEERDHDYQIHIEAEDGNGRVSMATVRIAVGAEAIVAEDPVKLEAVNTDLAPMSVLATKATLSGVIEADAENPQILYKKVSEPDNAWKSVGIQSTRASKEFSVTIGDLDPGTEYMYKAAAEGWTGTDIYRFTTESIYIIPFGDMETWADADGKANGYKQYPGNNYDEKYQFWDSGNHGSAGMSVSLTVGSTAMNNTPGGAKSAQLKSQFVNFLGMGKFAAGNLFMGRFGATVGTSGAQLVFGKPYNGSHPSKMSVWASYTPVAVDRKDSKCPYSFKSGELDHGQIYVAFATEPIPVNTGTSSKNGVPANTFMKYDTDERIIGFGEVTWTSAFGSPNELTKYEIDIDWRPGAQTKKPTTLIIVCSASKYGDYFTGGTGSILYVDDFEFIY